MHDFVTMTTQMKLDKWHVTRGDRIAQILIMENRLAKLPRIVLFEAFHTEVEDTQELEELVDREEKDDDQKEKEKEELYTNMNAINGDELVAANVIQDNIPDKVMT